jgi:ribitol-5-phosphate 2-dehydrogenase (NADP+) / D-ribitol-5-phosphate cytidylyltransferase
MQTVAVVLAGGSGRRFGGSLPKQLRLLAGRTLLEHCVAAFDQAPSVDEVLVVIAEELIAQTTAGLGGYAKLAGVVAGGSARTDSTRQAIAAIGLAGRECNVLFHDAARPLVDQRIIADCVAALERWQAIGVVVPSSDTIVEVAEGTLGRVLPRETLARCQTPQGFRFSVIRRAYELAAADPGFAALSATDDCGVVRRYLPDVPIGAVSGSARNMKVTYPGDIDIAEVLLRQDSGVP